MGIKRGQVTIFVVLAVVLISAIALFFIFSKGSLDLGGGLETDRSFLEVCMEDKIKQTMKLISMQGGYINNTLNKTFRFEDEQVSTDISFLCYTQNYYASCINHEPMLIQHLKEEIKNYISEDMENCFNDLTFSLKNKGFEVGAKYNGFEVELMPKKIVLDIDGEIILTKIGESSKQKDFNVIIPSKFYDLAVVVQEITSQEARFCNFEQLGFMLIYPQFNIDKFRTGDSVTIYTVQHRDSLEKFRFAVRSCVTPPGI